MIAQFPAVYFLSLLSCSINKLKSQMFFACKSFMFSEFTWKKIFCSRKWWVRSVGLALLQPLQCKY